MQVLHVAVCVDGEQLARRAVGVVRGDHASTASSIVLLIGRVAENASITSAAESAVREAWEEAGVRGAISGGETGRYRYEKWGGVCTVRVFLLIVEEEAERWPESGTRRREWLGIEEAAARVDEEDLRLLIHAAAGQEGEGR